MHHIVKQKFTKSKHHHSSLVLSLNHHGFELFVVTFDVDKVRGQGGLQALVQQLVRVNSFVP